MMYIEAIWLILFMANFYKHTKTNKRTSLQDVSKNLYNNRKNNFSQKFLKGIFFQNPEVYKRRYSQKYFNDAGYDLCHLRSISPGFTKYVLPTCQQNKSLKNLTVLTANKEIPTMLKWQQA